MYVINLYGVSWIFYVIFIVISTYNPKYVMSVWILFFILFINIYAFTNIVSVMQGKENK